MELKLKDVWYWTANFLLLASAFISMYVNNGYPLLIVSIPLALLDRAYVVPLLLFIAAIEGSFKVQGSSSDTESLAILAIVPFFAYDFIKHNGKMIPFKLGIFYIIFGVFLVIGIFVYFQHPQIQQHASILLGEKKGVLGVYIKMVMKIVKLIFFFIYLKVLINKDKDFLHRVLTLVMDLAPYLTILVALNMKLFGVVAEKFDTIHFGEAKHGDFSANMNALGIYIYLAIFSPQSSWFKRFVNIAALACLLFIVMEVASRNGLLCFVLLGIFGGIVVLWNRTWGFKTTIVTAAIFLVCAAAYFYKDSPTVQRFIFQTEVKGGGDRLSYWLAGVESLKEDPLLGLGGDETASLYAVDKYSPEVEDHVMHNTFLEFLVEYGWVGLFFYISFAAVVMFHAIKNFFFALKLNDVLLAAPSVSYFISMFAGLFISRIWESTIWYNMTFIFAIYILYRMPIEDAIKNRRAYLIRGLPDPLLSPSLALPST
jgi:hypothetical protein